MEVDHYDYRQKKDKFQDYNNLILASRHCNGAKQQKPTPKERALGLRILNPCAEVDYGVHIFEDPESRELIGTTPLGKYHIRTCDLNAGHLVRERRDRARIWDILKKSSGVVALRHGNMEVAGQAVTALHKEALQMIPELPLLGKTGNAAPASSKSPLPSS